MTRTPETAALPDDVLAALASRYGVHLEAVREVPGGVANRAFVLGDELFLRIPRTAEFVRDLSKEVAVIPVTRAAGVRTPAIVDFDATRTLVDAPYLVIERVHASDLTAGSHKDDTSQALWEEVGRQVALVHQVDPDTPLEGVEHDDGGGDPRPTVERLATDGYLDTGTARWLLAWFDRLATRFPQDEPHVLLHGDLGEQNLLGDSDHLSALIDWGDTAWGPPGMEFAKLPLERVAASLPSYKRQNQGRQGMEAAALWYHLSWGLSGLTKSPRPPQPHERHWTAPPASRLLGVLRFYAASPAEPWSALG